jgi:alpha-beta hydrolase superfamily lysophospholipase
MIGPLARRLHATAWLLLAAGCAHQASVPAVHPATVPAAHPAPVSALREAPPATLACPQGIPEGTRCLGGRDSAGAHYLIALPAAWTGVLVLHAHGGPSLGPPQAERAVQDLQRWAVMLKAGHAWAGSTFRDGGVQVRAAAENTERLRQIFVRHVATPQRTVLHGQSWGASVAAIGAETYAGAGGRPPYDAVLLTSGVLAGGTRAYDMRLDLRVIYQWLCNNHPRPDEPAYPLWMGLPEGATLTPAQLARRSGECLGLGRPAAARTPEQQRRLQTLVDVLHVPESSLQGHLNWATWHFQDVALRRTGGASPFGNQGAVYAGSPDDAALNAGVARYRADPAAVARFGADTDPTGRIAVPVLTVHGVDDPVAFVEMEAAFRDTMRRAGTADHLVQVFTADSEHSYLSDPLYPALVAALLDWVGSGVRPTPAALAERCGGLQARFGPGCRVLPDYVPRALEMRVAPRERP